MVIEEVEEEVEDEVFEVAIDEMEEEEHVVVEIDAIELSPLLLQDEGSAN